MAVKDGGPAFPTHDYLKSGEPGMTLRDFFAVHLAAAALTRATTSDKLDRIAVVAYAGADALIAEREKR